MVGKGKAISHTAASIEYGKNKKEIHVNPETGKKTKGRLASEEIDRNLIFGETAHEIANDMKIFQRGSTIKNTTFSFVVSPQKEVGDKFTKNDWRKLTQDFLNKIGALVDVPDLADQQAYISFLHTGTDTKHLHIYVNRILPNNKPIKDAFIGKKASLAAEQIAIERGYKTAKQVRQEKEALKNLEPEAIYIKESIEKAMKTYPKSRDEFLQQLKNMQIESELKFDSKEILRGLSFIHNEKKYKASELDRNLSGSKIDKTLSKNLLSRQKPTVNKIHNQQKPQNNNLSL
jgi:hypothetical protein